MDILTFIANILTFLTLVIHTSVGNRKPRIIEPELDKDGKFITKEIYYGKEWLALNFI